MSTLDVILFFIAVVGVIGFGIWKGRSTADGEGSRAANYFLAGRGLTWWLVGFSLIAANISTEQFVGMSGQAADWLGLAIASYEWMAAVTLVIVAFVFLPRFLRSGIYTVPEFLEYRFGPFSRTIMALATMVVLVGVPTASVIYSGAKVISVFFQDFALGALNFGDLTTGCWIIGISAAVYVFVGGLRACAWTDLIWGSSLIVGGAVVMVLAFNALADKPADELILTKVATSTVTVQELEQAGPIERLQRLTEGPAKEGPNGSGGKLHMVRPASDPAIPWTALLIGLWIPNFFYWGLNQYIMQRALGSRSLAEGQKGVVFAALLKLVIPFVVVIPGILAFHLYQSDLRAQADLKNAAVLKQFADKPAVVFPFTENFAALHPEVATELYTHNARLLGKEPDLEIPVEALADFNFALLSTSQDFPAASKLLGYDYDSAFPTLLRNLLKPGLTWFVLAAIFGAVVSSLASMLNSASTIATMDLFRKVYPGASQMALVRAGRVFVVIFILIACWIAPQLGRPEFGGIFTFIQEFQGFLSPGILGVFFFGFLIPRCPRYAGWLGILLNVVLYGSLKLMFPEIAFLNRMAICLGAVVAVLALATLLNPLKEPVQMPVNTSIPLTSSKSAKIGGVVICAATILLYIIFW